MPFMAKDRPVVSGIDRVDYMAGRGDRSFVRSKGLTSGFDGDKTVAVILG
jgi:hypothetical protein